jgi:precorrin-2 dehydrogenase/sirohydrochlorin ferrochelatase
MKPLPLFCKLNEKKVLLIGGGRIALRKTTSFSGAGADITLISPEVLEQFSQFENLKIIKRKAAENDITRDYSFVVLATNDGTTNEKLARRCKELNILCCRTDNLNESDFFTASRLEDGPVTVAVYSSGVPQMSKFIVDEISNSLADEVFMLAALLAELRPELKQRLPDEKARKELFSRFINRQTIQAIKQNGYKSVKQEILACL